jgi:DNA helicase II / ATP-dependent DNA helicase PcrA
MPRWNEGLEGPALDVAGAPETTLRVDAGPGSGKTFALMRRACRLLEEGVDPRRVMAATFTRTSATDLKKALRALGVDGADSIRAVTLHGYSFGLLKRDDVFGWTQRHPRALLDFEQRFLLEDLVDPRFGGIRLKEERLHAFFADWARLQSEVPGWPDDPVDQAFHQALLAWLRFHRAMLIGELISLASAYLRNNPLTELDHVLVDEYQDLNRAEQQLVDLVAAGAALAVVGDEDQSIYAFRNAHPEGMQDFRNTHPGTRDIELLMCRRCPPNIVAMANSLIARNQFRAPRRLVSRGENPPGEVRIVQWQDAASEAAGLAQFIAGQVEDGTASAGEILVLTPRRYFGYQIRDQLRALDVASHSFFLEEELDGSPKDEQGCRAQQAYTLLNLLADPDDLVSLRCWCGFGSSSLNRAGWEKIVKFSGAETMSVQRVLERLSGEQLALPYTGNIVSRYRALKLRRQELGELTGQRLIEAIFPEAHDWAASLNRLAYQTAPDDCGALELRDALLVAITQPELPTNVDYVRVMSLHKSKGLTADLVIVAGAIQGCIPRIERDLTPVEEQRFHEEQRRLFYVAITRPRKTLIISSARALPRSAAYRMGVPVRGQNPDMARTIASVFIDELGADRPATIQGVELLR